MVGQTSEQGLPWMATQERRISGQTHILSLELLHTLKSIDRHGRRHLSGQEANSPWFIHACLWISRIGFVCRLVLDPEHRPMTNYTTMHDMAISILWLLAQLMKRINLTSISLADIWDARRCFLAGIKISTVTAEFGPGRRDNGQLMMKMCGAGVTDSSATSEADV